MRKPRFHYYVSLTWGDLFLGVRTAKAYHTKGAARRASKALREKLNSKFPGIESELVTNGILGPYHRIRPGRSHWVQVVECHTCKGRVLPQVYWTRAKVAKTFKTRGSSSR